MTYRMVIAPPKYDPEYTYSGPPVTRFWYEARRDLAPSWMSEILASWWTRWRRISGKRNMVLKNGAFPMVAYFDDETEMYQFQAYLERCEG